MGPLQRTALGPAPKDGPGNSNNLGGHLDSNSLHGQRYTLYSHMPLKIWVCCWTWLEKRY